MSNARELAKAASSYGSGGFVGMKNRLINGSMIVNQRLAGAQGTYAYNAPQDTKFGVDRWNTTFFAFSSGAGNMATLQQVSDAPSGFTKSLKVVSISGFTPGGANAGIGGFITQSVEGLNIIDMVNPAGGLYPMALSFWVKANKTGTVSVCVEANAAVTGCHYMTTVTINAANTWEYKSVSIPASSFGVPYTDTNSGLAVNIGLCTNGSWLTGTPNQWNTDANRAVLSASQTNFMSSAGDSFQITGAQLEKGTQATPFEFRHYGTELSLCQRYYCTSINDSAKVGWIGRGTGNYVVHGYAPFPVPMRTTPSVSFKAYHFDASSIQFGDGRNGTCVYATSPGGASPAYTVHTYGYGVTASTLGIIAMNQGENSNYLGTYAAGYVASAEL